MRRAAGPAVFLAALGLLSVDVLHGFWDHDSGFYLLHALFIAKGFRPYLDYVTIYPPLFGILNAGPVLLGIDRWALTVGLPILWAASISLLSLAWWRRSAPGTGEWVVAAMFPLFCIEFGGNHLTLELGVIFFGLLALYGFLAAGARAFFLAGVFLGCAFLVKQVGLLMFLPFALQIRSRRETLCLVGGSLVPVLPLLVWLDFDLGAVLRSARALGGYIDQATSNSLGQLGWGIIQVLSRELHRTPPGMAFLAGTLALGFLGTVSLAFRHDSRQAVWLGSWTVVALGYFAARAIQNFPHYTLNCWPAILVLVSVSWRVVSARVRHAVVWSSVLFSCLVLVSLGGRVTDIGGRPYFRRWEGPGQLDAFLRPVATELDALLPVGASVAQNGLEESILFFLTDRLPRNREWPIYDLPPLIEGDAILFVDHAQGSASIRRGQIAALGYTQRRIWESRWGSIILYAR